MTETTQSPMITAQMVADLRNQSDAPMMQCKQALIPAEGDMRLASLAFEFIRYGIPPKPRQTLFEALTGCRAMISGTNTTSVKLT